MVSEAHPLSNQKDNRHTRRASEKIKKCMKMADLKAFVELKLLSKSDKALEKIGQDGNKSLYTQVRKLNERSFLFICLMRKV